MALGACNGRPYHPKPPRPPWHRTHHNASIPAHPKKKTNKQKKKQREKKKKKGCLKSPARRTDEEAELVEAVAVNGHPLADHGLEEGLAPAGALGGRHEADERGQRVGGLLLHQRLVTHPHAEKERLPDPERGDVIQALRVARQPPTQRLDRLIARLFLRCRQTISKGERERIRLLLAHRLAHCRHRFPQRVDRVFCGCDLSHAESTATNENGRMGWMCALRKVCRSYFCFAARIFLFLIFFFCAKTHKNTAIFLQWDLPVIEVCTETGALFVGDAGGGGSSYYASFPFLARRADVAAPEGV